MQGKNLNFPGHNLGTNRLEGCEAMLDNHGVRFPLVAVPNVRLMLLHVMVVLSLERWVHHDTPGLWLRK
jgi:hypothetical protein